MSLRTRPRVRVQALSLCVVEERPDLARLVEVIVTTAMIVTIGVARDSQGQRNIAGLRAQLPAETVEGLRS
jgi:hypothetical protein